MFRAPATRGTATIAATDEEKKALRPAQGDVAAGTWGPCLCRDINSSVMKGYERLIGDSWEDIGLYIDGARADAQSGVQAMKRPRILLLSLV